MFGYPLEAPILHQQQGRGLESCMQSAKGRICDVQNGEEYCGEACPDAGSEDVEIACQCDHMVCPLMFRRVYAWQCRWPGWLTTTDLAESGLVHCACFSYERPEKK